MTGEERKLLKLIAAVPAGEKLPLARLARDLNASQPVVIGLIDRLIGDGEIDQSTLRPPPPRTNAARRGIGGRALFDILIAEGRRRDMGVQAVSNAVFAHHARIYALRDAAGPVRAATIARVEAWLGGTIPRGEISTAPQPSVGAAPARAEAGGDPERQAKTAPASPPSEHPTGEQLLAEIEAFKSSRGWRDSDFARAVGRPGICEQLRRAKFPQQRTVDAVRAFIAAPPVSPTSAAEAGRASLGERHQQLDRGGDRVKDGRPSVRRFPEAAARRVRTVRLNHDCFVRGGGRVK